MTKRTSFIDVDAAKAYIDAQYASVKGVGFCVGAGVPQRPRVNTFIECGCCSAYHRTDFVGDCREDSERYDDIPEGGEEVELEAPSSDIKNGKPSTSVPSL